MAISLYRKRNFYSSQCLKYIFQKKIFRALQPIDPPFKPHPSTIEVFLSPMCVCKGVEEAVVADTDE